MNKQFPAAALISAPTVAALLYAKEVGRKFAGLQKPHLIEQTHRLTFSRPSLQRTGVPAYSA